MYSNDQITSAKLKIQFTRWVDSFEVEILEAPDKEYDYYQDASMLEDFYDVVKYKEGQTYKADLRIEWIKSWTDCGYEYDMELYLENEEKINGYDRTNL